ncbi:hypothetical protein Tco_1144350 [Tanacetum coccineum]
MVEKSKLEEDKEGKASIHHHYRDADHAGCQDTRRLHLAVYNFWVIDLSKHIDIRFHFIKEHVENGVIELTLSIRISIADNCTKALGRKKNEFLSTELGMRSFKRRYSESIADEFDE